MDSNASVASVRFEHLKKVDGLEGPFDITGCEWREYEFLDKVYRIEKPVALYYHKGGTTHRVVDNRGVTHCVPSPENQSIPCVLRWYAPGDYVRF